MCTQRSADRPDCASTINTHPPEFIQARFFQHCNKLILGEDHVEERQHRHSERDSEGRDDEQEPLSDSVPHRAAPRHPRPQQRLQRDHHCQESRAFHASLSVSPVLREE